MGISAAYTPDERERLLVYMRENVHQRFHRLYMRARGLEPPPTPPPSRAAAQKMMCVECQGGGWDSGVVAAIRYCEDWRCPNLSVRPYQDKDETPIEAELSEEEIIELAQERERKLEALKRARAARVEMKAKKGKQGA